MCLSRFSIWTNGLFGLFVVNDKLLVSEEEEEKEKEEKKKKKKEKT